MFAVIKTGGKQYRVAVGDVLKVEKLPAEAGDTVTFDSVLMHGGDGGTTVGTPLVDGAVVTGEIIEQFRDKKIVVFKKRRRKHSSKTRNGHRQYLTRVRISGLPGDADGSKSKSAADKKAKADAAAAAEAAEADKDDVVAEAPAAPASKAAAPAQEARAPSDTLTRPSNLIEGEVTDADDIEKLPGLGKASETALNKIGVYYYSQFVEWNASDWEFIESYIDENVNGTINVSRPSIVTQANRLIESRAAAAKED